MVWPGQSSITGEVRRKASLCFVFVVWPHRLKPSSLAGQTSKTADIVLLHSTILHMYTNGCAHPSQLCDDKVSSLALCHVERGDTWYIVYLVKPLHPFIEARRSVLNVECHSAIKASDECCNYKS